MHYFEKSSTLSPAILSMLRLNSVNNHTFGKLAALNGFQRFISHTSPDLMSDIDNYVQRLKQKEEAAEVEVDDEHILYGKEEEEIKVAALLNSVLSPALPLICIYVEGGGEGGRAMPSQSSE